MVNRLSRIGFRKIALDIGLEGKKLSASAGAQLSQRLAGIAVDLTAAVGPYPHAAMRVNAARYPAARPAPKAACPTCGYRVSMLMKHFDIDPLICPEDNIPMERKGRWEWLWAMRRLT